MPTLNRIITIEHPVTVRGRFGGEVTTWETYNEVWADKRQTSGDERFVAGANVTVATRAATWRVNFDPSITELMRVVDDQKRVWNIIGLAVIGFNRYHDMICQSDGTRL